MSNSDQYQVPLSEFLALCKENARLAYELQQTKQELDKEIQKHAAYTELKRRHLQELKEEIQSLLLVKGNSND